MGRGLNCKVNGHNYGRVGLNGSHDKGYNCSEFYTLETLRGLCVPDSFSSQIQNKKNATGYFDSISNTHSTEYEEQFREGERGILQAEVAEGITLRDFLYGGAGHQGFFATNPNVASVEFLNGKFHSLRRDGERADTSRLIGYLGGSLEGLSSVPFTFFRPKYYAERELLCPADPNYLRPLRYKKVKTLTLRKTTRLNTSLPVRRAHKMALELAFREAK